MSFMIKSHFVPRNIKKNWHIYGNYQSFLRHLSKHILDKAEGSVWRRLLPSKEEPWVTLRKARYRKKKSDIFDYLDEGQQELFQAAYDDVAEYVAKGLSYADQTPLFVIITEQLRNTRTNTVEVRETYHCLSQDGCILYASDGVLRTAFFSLHPAQSQAPYDLYWAGLHHILARTQRAKTGMSWYHPEYGHHVSGISVQMMTEENLSNSKNPWPKPKARYAKKIDTESTLFEREIYQKYVEN